MSSELHFLHLSLPCGVVNQPTVIDQTHTDRMTGKWWRAAERRGARNEGAKRKGRREAIGQSKKGDEEQVEGMREGGYQVV